MTMHQRRLQNIKRLTAEAAGNFTSTRIDNLESLVNSAYQVRKSSSFRYFVHQLFEPHFKPKALVANVNEILERLGQLSKFVRAASTIIKHVRKMDEMKIALVVNAAPSNTFTIPELSRRNAADLRARGGQRCSNFTDGHLESMLKRWSEYREHAEMQLISFYEENPMKILHTPYIGCNKLSCFLCFTFIVQHGQFYVSGCHQSLYSLWTVRNIIDFKSSAAATKYKHSLAYVSAALEDKVEAFRSPTWISPGGGTGKESVADLSRTSLAFSDEAATAMSISSGTGIDGTLDVDKHARWPSGGLFAVVEEDEMTMRSYQSSSTAGTLMPKREAIARDREWPSTSSHKPLSEKQTAREPSHIDTGRRYSLQTWQTSCYHATPQKPRRRKHKRQRRQRLGDSSVYQHLRTSKESESKNRRHTSRRQENVHRYRLRKLARFVKKVLFGANTTVMKHERFA